MFTVLLPVVLSCGRPTQHQRTSAGAFVHYRSPALPAGSIVLPDSLGGLGQPSRIALNPANGHVYVCGRGWGVLVIDAATGKRVDIIPATDVAEMQYNPIANVLYLWSCPGESYELITVDCATDSIVAREPLTLWPTCANLRDNKLYASTGEGRNSAVAVLDGYTHRLLARVGSGPLSKEGVGLGAIVWNPTSNAAYYSDGRGAVVAIDGRTNEEVARIPNSADLEPRCANPRNNKIYASSYRRPDSSLAVIDCRTNRIVAWLPVNVNIADVVYNPVENKVYCSGGGGLYGGMPSVAVIDGEYDAIVERANFRSPPGGLCYDSINNRMYCFGFFGGIAAIDCRNDSTIMTIDTFEVDRAVFSAAANRLYCLDWSQGDVNVVDGATLRVIDTLTLGYQVESMLYNRQQDKLYCANHTGHALAVIDGASRRVLSTIEVGRSPGALACTPNGNRLYCANEADGTVSVIDCRSDRVLASTRVGPEPTALYLSPSTHRLFCATKGGYGEGSDSTIRVIDCRTNSVIGKLPAHRYAGGFVYDTVNDRVFCASNTGYDGMHEPAAQIGAFTASTLVRDFSVELPGTVIDMRYDPVHDRLYVARAAPDEISEIDCKTGISRSVMRTVGRPEKLCYSARRHKLYCASKILGIGKRSEVDGGSAIVVVDTDGDSSVATIKVPAGPSALRYVPEVDRVYCACAGADTVVVIDCATDRIVDRKAVGAGPAALEYSSQHGVVFVANSRGSSISYIRDASVSEPKH